MTHPTPDPLREAAQAVLDCWDSRNWKAAPTADYMRRLRAALAATPQPAPAPAADERDEIERIICDAFTCDLRGRGDEDGAFWQTAADALLAAGYRKADALLAERDALIHDIERAKESESALLAERDAARAEGYRRGLEIAATTAEQRDPEKPSSFLHRREQIAEAIRALPLTDAG